MKPAPHQSSEGHTSNVAIADDVITTKVTDSELQDEINLLSERISFLEVMLMRILDALELSHNIDINSKKRQR